MSNRKVSSLRDGHTQARGFLSPTSSRGSAPKQQKRTASKTLLERIFPDERAELLKDIPMTVIRDAWSISAHLLLDEEAHIVDMGCETGEMAFALSHIKPNWKITAIDADAQAIKYAKEHYKNKNLTFITQDISTPDLKEKSVDAIINSFVLHEVYSEAKFNIRRIRETLATHYKALKTGGFMFIRDHTTSGPGEYVLMELKSEPSKSEDLNDLSEADLLIWFAENVRSGDALTTGGFYLEELPPRFPNTRLFRLPHKWAHEFILRKDDRERLEEDLDIEYAFATKRDLRGELRALGGRLIYCASNWDDDFVKKNMIDHFKLYKENGDPLGYPETSYTMLVQKVKKQDSTHYQEWRTSRNKADTLTVESMRNNETGVISDIVSRQIDTTEIIPFYETAEGELRVFVQENIPRSLANTVPRQGRNIDGREWSGHMIEALSFNAQDIKELEESKTPKIAQFIKDQLDLKTDSDEEFIHGPTSYPDPKTINERTDTRFIQVHDLPPKKSLEQTDYTPPEGIR
ncbi:MAG: class I SAM-dependent methyltransferase, partial [Bdellovibrionales bacterium]